MPFNLQTKGLIVGLVLGAVVVPRVVSAVSSRTK